MTSKFDIEDISVPTTAWVREQHAQHRGGWIHGATGSGKSHAVRAAELGGMHVDVCPGPLLGQRFAVDLALQLGLDGRSLLVAVRQDGLESALRLADGFVNGHALVVDSAEQLLVDPINMDDPATALWQDDKNALREWLTGRMDRTPTFLLTRWSPGEGAPRYRHYAPSTWPVRLRQTSDGFRDWPKVAELARNNPAALTLARALVLLLRADAFNSLLDEAEEDDANIARRLGQAFRWSAPKAWQKSLAILAALGPVPVHAVDAVLAHGSSDAGTPEPMSDEESLAAVRTLRQLKLVEDRNGKLSVLPALSSFGAIRPITEQERTSLLPAVAHQLLAPINDLRNLAPEHADRVLQAHAVFVAAGDAGNAERTAALHVHGLVELARRTSLNEDFSNAWKQYDGVLRMLQSGDIGVADRFGRRLLSYVQHYRVWNGWRASVLDDAACLNDYAQAAAEWPENALWHQRVVQTLVRLGRPVDARGAVELGYRQVEEHPRRDEFLRVRPAWTALEAGAVRLSLELIEPLLQVSPDAFPEVADGRDALLRRWERGLHMGSLTFSRDEVRADQVVEFLHPTEVRIRRVAGEWAAQMRDAGAESRGGSPLGALDNLARNLGEETRRLVSTPTSKLTHKDIRQKGRLLSIVDTLNSDIGLEHVRERWVVGRLEGNTLVPTMRDLPAVPIPPELVPEGRDGLYFVKVPVLRDGQASGPAEAVKPAGSGFAFGELVKLLAQLNEEAP